MIERLFRDACSEFTQDEKLINDLWVKIYTHYFEVHRHYHTLHHLSNMHTQLEQCRASIDQWDCIVFALCYHDLIYRPSSNDNEEQSAVEARKDLTLLKLPPEKIGFVEELILATKTHVISINNDVNLFTNADLCVLGASTDLYKIYSQQIREEYSIYPDILYKPGRKKVLKHFLDMPAIFKTDFFRERFELAARTNIENELREL